MARVLVIDDDENFRFIVAEILRAEGYDVEDVGDGGAGVDRAREKHPDLILCDIRMNGMDGYTVLAELRQDPTTGTIPVIFLTGVAGASSLRKGMDLGADDYLVKPVDQSELLRAVEARLTRHVALRSEVERRLEHLQVELAQSLPHEFLTPLTAVMGLSSLLAEGDPTLEPEIVPEIARSIFLGGQRLQEIIAKFITFAELEAAGTERGPVGSTPLVEEVARGQARRAGREADLDLQIEDAKFAIPPDHARAVVAELVENAFAFSDEGTIVSVVVREHRDRCVLSVSDTGRGMTEAQLQGIDKIAPFSRRHHDQPGIGLGLAIVRRVVHLWGGEVTFDSTRGEGTTVRVALPTGLRADS
jgi:signal transduction histidine kinase